ncbi:MAG: 16S rRNA (cytidine(1402)-2'-O)-methyltransferase [Omnitrophica WOR_2 bacterium RIFCSPLOWO2_02_FULL_63_16]|nr:MAG: 16S rRNA (cytidine(1402)-2'-O)-methyltransferase [Omnitrophica WOR_2 bacterium GWF2_63_9]OGX36280.1 MAG: 16S rRNA (cytidine(1402)-2'-O)-methyltransferase [Omnitrophica WOR_2 bacterium RIFCSPHIGHO2_02_FULL_63_39]OGX46113.1 MAG: 16S rRNA (cytidine(1402)-2'-O)-methyltransferase [Omnitrophica WOR_2 bacterium RIFCSPLOWO2_02_FULL_63_16]
MATGGTLYLVSTPVGNLGDLTLRAIETLKGVDVIACEDTRQTGKLLAHYQIRKPLTSLHDHNERQKTPQLIGQLKSGQSIALVSDGGTPLVSDPGWYLVRRAIDAGIAVSWIPGATALIGALVLSGLPTDRFVFEGFLPPKPGARRKRLEALKDEPRTVVLYESPHRLLKTLRDIRETLGDIQMTCARELTKMFEEVRRGTASELITHFERRAPRGELVLCFSLRTPHSAFRIPQ